MEELQLSPLHLLKLLLLQTKKQLPYLRRTANKITYLFYELA